MSSSGTGAPAPPPGSACQTPAPRGTATATAGGRSVSADGRYVAFHSYATNLVPGDTNDAYDVFVRDRRTGTTTRVSVCQTAAPRGTAAAAIRR